MHLPRNFLIPDAAGMKAGKLLLVSVLFYLSACSQEATTDPDRTAREIHERVLTLDSHVDIARDYMLKPEFDPGLSTRMKVDLEKMEAGGLDAAFFIVYVEQGPRTAEGYASAQQAARIKFSAIHKMADEAYRDRISLAYHPFEVESIYRSGKKVAVIGNAASALQFVFQAMGLAVPYQLFLMLPYVLTLLALAGVVGRVRPPASLGRPIAQSE